MRVWIAAAMATAVLALAGAAQAARPLTAKDMAMMERVASPRLSPDGHWLAFSIRSTDWAANKGVNALWVLDMTAADKTAKKLAVGDGADPHWSPDGRTLYFLSSRTKTSEIWRTSPEGGVPVQVTTSPVDITAYRVSPDGRALVFAALAYPNCKTLACSADRHKARGEDKAEGEVYDKLGVRFWDAFGDGRYSHLFSQPLNETGAASGEAAPVMGDLASDVPSRPEGDEGAFTLSPDGRTVIFAAHDPASAPGVTTKSILYAAPLDGTAPPHALSPAGLVSESDPVFSPDGGRLAFLRRASGDFGAARASVIVRDLKTGKEKALAQDYDRSPAKLAWSEDGKTLYATAEDAGAGGLIAIDTTTGAATILTRHGHVGDYDLAQGKLVISQDSLGAPADLYLLAPGGRAQLQLTHANLATLADLPMGDTYEPFTFAGWNGETVHGWVVKPYGWKPGFKYPTAFLIHGGPHGSFGDAWSYRWNPQAWAGLGYAVVMVDFHGSSGYGEAFAQSIINHWGDRPLEDLQKGWAAAQAKYPWIDGSRACALGGSYGGYMVDWIAGNWNGPWKCLVDHDGILDTRLMAYATDIPGFSEVETGFGLKDPAAVEAFNPINHLGAWSKPILVIHGGKDYRVPFDQGLGAFTAAQRKGVPSEFLYFASENHWVLKPQNSVQWYDTVGRWMARWIGDTAPVAVGK